MATKTFYLTNNVDAQNWCALSESTQSAVTTGSGWTVSTGATNHSELESGTERAASTFTGTGPPDGSLDSSLGDAFRTPNPLSGDFANAAWDWHFVVRAVTNGGAQDGRVRFRLFRSANADGSGATEITAGQQQAAAVTNVSTSADFDSSSTFNPGAFSLANEYLFVQIAWERTGAGDMSNSDILFRTGSSSSAGTRITTSDFTPAPAVQGSELRITSRFRGFNIPAIFNLLKTYDTTAMPVGAGGGSIVARCVVRKYPFSVGANFNALSLGWNSTIFAQQAAPQDTAVYGSEYQPRAKIGTYKAKPPAFDNPAIPQQVQQDTAVYGSEYQPRAKHGSYKAQPPAFDNPAVPQPAILWGDSYQPRGQHKSHRAREPFRDNPVIGQAAAVTAIIGDGFQFRRRFKQPRISFSRGAGPGAPAPPPEFPLYPSELWCTSQFPGYGVATSFNILGRGWGSTAFVQAGVATAVYGSDYTPRRRFGWFYNAAVAFATLSSAWGTSPLPNTAILWGDGFQPRAQHASYKAREPFRDNPPFIQAAPATAIYGAEYSPRWKFKFPNMAPGFLWHMTRAGSASGPPSIPAIAGGMKTKRKWRRGSS